MYQHSIIGITGLTLIAAVTLGCDDNKSDESNQSAAKPAANEPTTAAEPEAPAEQASGIDVDAVNAAVPDGLELSFTTATIDDELEAVVPEGWEASEVIPGTYRPSGSGFGFFTKYRVGSNCDGACTAKDWASVVEKVEFELGDAEVLKDEELPNGRIAIVRDGDRTRVIAAWWKADASQYFYCRAELQDDAAEAVDAFEKACRRTRVLAW